MPAYARRQIVDDSAVGVYHCVNRCVRRAFLCGQDDLSGRSFEHRRHWIRDRLEQLAGLFAVDILGFAVMQNHLHAILRTRPDLAAEWADEEIARRWWELFPARRDQHGTAEPPEEHELRALMADPLKLAERRRRLASLSWLMRCLCEPIARRANREDACTGRFWEGRFKCQALLDEAAILACSTYVDLNPIRAGITATPEESEFTAAFERIAAYQTETVEPALPSPIATPAACESPPGLPVDGWLAPIALEPTSAPLSAADNTATPAKPRRASDRGFLSMRLTDYLQLLDWTGRQLRSGKTGAIPAHLAPIMERLQLNASTWTDTVRNFGRWFHRAVGRTASLSQFAQARGKRWLQGVGNSRLAFG